MKTVKINNHELKLYDSIDEMPIVNFQKYNKYIKQIKFNGEIK